MNQKKWFSYGNVFFFKNLKVRWINLHLTFTYFIISIPAILFLLASCTSKTKIKEYSYTKFLKDSVVFKAKREISCVLYGKTLQDNIYLHNNADSNQIICFNSKGKCIDTICYPASKELGESKGMYAFNIDSFALLFPGNLLLYDKKTKFQKVFKLCDKTQKCESDDEPLLVDDSLTFFYKYPNLPPYLNTQENWDKYSDTACYQAVFDLKGNIFEHLHNPSYPFNIYKGNSYYSDGNHCINTKKHEIITSYAHSTKMVIYKYLKDTCYEINVPDPDFITNSKFDFNKIFEYTYVVKYLVENTRFDIIRYNSYRNEYYRILYAQMNSVNKDSTVNLPQDKPFSI